MNSEKSEALARLKRFDALCKRHNITYYAAKGTCLGAVRHEGFLPWESEISVYMSRKNFELFKNVSDKEKPPGKIQINIFILDPVPDDPQIILDHFGKLNLYADFIVPYFVYTNRINDQFLDEYKRYRDRSRIVGKERMIQELEDELFSYEEDECEYYVLRWATLPRLFNKSVFGKPKYKKFEDMYIPIPNDFYSYLMALYGPKWMYLEPKEKDKEREVNLEVNLKYINFLIKRDSLVPPVDQYEKYIKRKSIIIEKEMLTRALKNQMMRSDCNYVLVSQKRRLLADKINLSQLWDNGEYEKIIEVYEHYMEIQFSEEFIGSSHHIYSHRSYYKIFIPLPDKQLEVLVASLFLTEDIVRCQELINLRKTIGPLTDILKNIEEKVDNLFDLYRAFFSYQFEICRDIIARFNSEERRRMTFIHKVMLKLRIYENSDPEVTITLIRSLIRKRKEDKEYVKLLGDCYYQLGDFATAKTCYAKAMTSLNNGMMMLDIKHKFPELLQNYVMPSPKKAEPKFEDVQNEALAKLTYMTNKKFTAISNIKKYLQEKYGEFLKSYDKYLTDEDVAEILELNGFDEKAFVDYRKGTDLNGEIARLNKGLTEYLYTYLE